MTALTIDDARLVAEQLADVLAERGLIAAAQPAAGRLLDTAQVAELLGRTRDWVYEHAVELGAIRMGSGPRARLGFDQHAIDAWKSRQQIATPPATPRPAPKRARARRSSVPDLIPFEEKP